MPKRQYTVSEAARLLNLARGALARPTDNPDDPFDRVILVPCKASASASRLTLQAPTASAPAAAREAIAAQCAAELKKGAAPRRIAISGLGAFEVQRLRAPPARPLENRVAVVTGAAGAIGGAICRSLLEKGCRVAAADLSEPGLRALAAELAAGPDRLISVTMDVTDPASVSAGFDAVALAWGGTDIVVVNAGIAMVAPLADMDVAAFRRLERVNVEGTLLTIAEAGRRLAAQGTGGDIILISTKNVFAPGAQFGAYSATKAAAHQIARIASLELAPAGIRVNMVSPDAVFSDGSRRSGLWAEVGPSRMRARGLDEKGLEEYYRSRNLLKARVTGRHVANAVLFFATRQTPTTGATLPVDGGLPDATPR